jgi:hypothetical protein
MLGGASAPSVTASMFHLNLPAAPFQMPNPNNPAAAFMVPPEFNEPEGESKPTLGPLGLLAVGATVAISCYLLVYNFFMK